MEALYLEKQPARALPTDSDGRTLIPKPGDPRYISPADFSRSDAKVWSTPTRTDIGTIRAAEPSRHQLNRLRERWSSPPGYLEIIYEEGEEDEAKLRENPIYDNPFLENKSKAIQSNNNSKTVLPDKVKDDMRKELAGLLKSGTVSAKSIAERADELGLGGIGNILHFIDPMDIVEVTEKLEVVSVNN